MLKAYRVIYRTIINGQCIGSDSIMTICESSDAVNHSTIITWENVKERISMDFWLKFTRKGKVICYNDKKHFFDRTIKQWETPNLDIKLTVEYEERKMSMRELMQYRDADIAIQYMIEHGITINSMRR